MSVRMWFICISSGILLYCKFVLLHDSLKKALITFCVKHCVVNRHSRIVRNEQDFCCTFSTQFNYSYFQKWLFQEIKNKSQKAFNTDNVTQCFSINFITFVCKQTLTKWISYQRKVYGSYHLMQLCKFRFLFNVILQIWDLNS